MRLSHVVRLLALAALAVWPGTAPAEDPPRDPWIGQAVAEVLGRKPTEEEWAPAHWGGEWSGYGDLCNKVRAKRTEIGAAYIFIKPDQAARFGHFGWGFLLDDGWYLCGSTENPTQGLDPKALSVDPGQPNGYWSKRVRTERDMLQTMSDAVQGGSSGYWHYKSTLVMVRKSAAGEKAAEDCRTAGFGGVNRNCLDQGIWVLDHYGVDREVVMPPASDHWAPNEWFKAFGRITGSLGSGYWKSRPDPKDPRTVTGEPLPGVGCALINCGTNDVMEAIDDDPKQGETFDANRVELQWKCWSWQQQWFLTPVPGEVDTYTISCRNDPRKVLDVPRGEATDGLAMCMWTPNGEHGGDNQRWIVRYCAADDEKRPYYLITNKLTGLALTQPVFGRSLVQAPERADWRQRWRTEQ